MYTELGIFHSDPLSQANLPHFYLVPTLILCSDTLLHHLDLAFCHQLFQVDFDFAILALSALSYFR